MAFLRAVYIIWFREVLRFWRDRTRLISSLAQPFLFLVIFGSGISSSVNLLAPGLDYRKFMFPGIIGMSVLFTSIFSAVSIVWDREFGFLKEILVAPIPRSGVAIGKALGGSTIATFQGSLILIFAPFIGVPLSVPIILKLLPVMFLLAFAINGLGIVVAARMKSMQGFQMVMNLLLMPMFFLSGAIFPLRNLPTWMEVLVKIDPLTYGVDPLRRIVLETLPSNLELVVLNHQMTLLDDLLVVAAFGIVSVSVAVWSFGIQE